MNKIFAIVGMCGSGKSVASEYLENNSWKKVYFGGITLEKMKEENIEINEINERKMRESLRKEYGMAAYAILSLPNIRKYYKEGNVVIDGLYSWDEYKVLKDEFKDSFVMIAIIADKNIRYERLENRNFRSLTNEQAQNRDYAEIENMAKGGPIAMADYYIYNNGLIEDYIERLNEIIDRECK